MEKQRAHPGRLNEYVLCRVGAPCDDQPVRLVVEVLLVIVVQALIGIIPIVVPREVPPVLPVDLLLELGHPSDEPHTGILADDPGAALEPFEAVIALDPPVFELIRPKVIGAEDLAGWV